MSNYTLSTGKKYIKDIFDKEWFYNIPEYQRPYVWGKDQVETLLNDITTAMERDFNKEYFLGCMIWNTKKATESNYNYQDILDGQQRFITLYLLQGVIRDLSDAIDLKNEVKERLLQEGNRYRGIPKRNRIKFVIRNDESFLEKYLLPENATLQLERIREISENRLEGTSVRNMANAILVMNKWWKERKRKDEYSFQEYLDKFYIYLSNKVLLLFLATPNNLDDAYNLFTVLNSRGLQLQVSDILRAQNLRVIKDDIERKAFAKKWNEYENRIDIPLKSFDEFLWMIVFIKMKYRSDDNKSLTKAFDFMYRRKLMEPGVDTFNLIGKYIGHFEEITNENIIDKDTGFFFSNLIYIMTTTVGNTFLPALLHYKESFGTYRIMEFLIKLDNLCSTYWLLGKRNLQSRIFMILRRIDDFSKNYDQDLAADKLLSSEILKYDYKDEKAATMIDINELYELFDTENWGSFGGSKVNKTKYLLLKLDLLISNFHTRIYFNRTQSSVEHLMSRKIKLAEWDISLAEHKLWLHRLGNIVLLDKKKNSSLSNSSFERKRSKYRGAIENRANTNWLFISYSKWDKNAIQQNHTRVLNLLKEYYDGNDLNSLLALKKKINQINTIDG